MCYRDPYSETTSALPIPFYFFVFLGELGALAVQYVVNRESCLSITPLTRVLNKNLCVFALALLGGLAVLGGTYINSNRERTHYDRFARFKISGAYSSGMFSPWFLLELREDKSGVKMPTG